MKSLSVLSVKSVVKFLIFFRETDRVKHIAGLAVVLAFLFGNVGALAQMQYEKEIQAIGERFVPDTRLNIFETVKTDTGTEVVTSSAEAYAALKELAAKPNAGFVPKLWPDENPRVGEKSYGVVNLSVVSVRCQGGHTKELATQALLGMPLRILDAPADLSDDSPWIRIQSQDNYIGYVTYSSITMMTRAEWDAWRLAKKIIWTENSGHVYKDADDDSPYVSDVVAGDVLAVTGVKDDDYLQVRFPDGRLAWADEDDCQDFDRWIQQCDLTPEKIVATAKRFMGVPYLWGGTSSKSLDCSGLVAYVLFLNRISSLRDVSQQMRDGTNVDISQGLGNIQAGDFLIFGERDAKGEILDVRHIGIAMGNNEFIHAATDVHVSSFDPAAPNHDARNTKALVKAIRYCGAPFTATYKPLKDNPNYKK